MFLFTIGIILFVIVCLILVLLVLIQSDKGGGISGSIGGGLSGAGAAIGTQDTANILTKGTTIFAIVYMALTFTLSFFLSRHTGEESESKLKNRAQQQESAAPSSALQDEGLPVKEEEKGAQNNQTADPQENRGGSSEGEGLRLKDESEGSEGEAFPLPDEE